MAHAATGEILKWALLGPLSAGFLILAGWLFLRLWGVVWAIPVAGPAVAETLWSAFLTFVAVFLFYSHLLTTLSVFYASHDLPLLLSTPLSFGVLHRQRCVETLVRSSAMILFVLVPAAAAQWAVLDTGWWGWLGGSVMLATLFLGSGLLGIWAGQMVASLLPARRIHQFLVLFGLALSGILVVVLRASRLELLWSEGVELEILIDRLNAAAGPLAQFRPARETAAWVLGGSAGGVDVPLPYATLTMAVCGLALLAFRAERRFWKGWAKAGQGSPGGTPWPADLAPVRRIGSACGAFLSKDLATELRTGRRWSQLLMMVPLGAIYVINLRMIPGDSEALAPLFGWLNFLFAVFIVVAISARFLVPAASMEGRASWVWRSSPISARRWLAVKLIGYLPVAVFVGVVFFALGQVGAGLEVLVDTRILAYLFVVSLSIGVAAVALGAAFPLPDAQHELQVSLSTGGLLFIVLSLGYLLWIAYVLIGPAFAALELSQMFGWNPGGPPGPPWLWVLAGSSLLMLAPTWLAVRRWSHAEDI